MKLFLATIGLVASFAVNAAPILGLFNTGVDNAGTPLGNNVPDPHWTLTTAPGGTALPAETVPNGFPIGPWLPNSGTSRWIGPAAPSANGPGGTYTYQTTFDLTGLDSTSATIFGQIATDNSVVGARLNGTPIAQLNSAGFTAYHTFSVSAGTPGYQAGINTLEIDVNNASAGPTGLRIENLTGVALPDASLSPIAGLANTGSGAFTVSSSPLGPFVPAPVAVDGFPIPPWIANDASSQWIGSPFDGDSNGPPGDYDFDLPFTLVGVDPATAVIAGLWASDNGVRIFLNGVDTGITGGGFGSMQPFEISAGAPFVLGANTLTFRLSNAGGGPNPFGLRVGGLVGGAAPVPEPGTVLLAAITLLGALFGRAKLKSIATPRNQN